MNMTLNVVCYIKILNVILYWKCLLNFLFWNDYRYTEIYKIVEVPCTLHPIFPNAYTLQNYIIIVPYQNQDTEIGKICVSFYHICRFV